MVDAWRRRQHRVYRLSETWLEDWVGFVEETVFDVNLIMLDETKATNAENKELEKKFNEHGIDMIRPIDTDTRDAGWHCITLDVEREGPRGLWSVNKYVVQMSIVLLVEQLICNHRLSSTWWRHLLKAPCSKKKKFLTGMNL